MILSLIIFSIFSKSSLLGSSVLIISALTSPLKSSHAASDWIKKHGDGVRDVAFSVLDVQKCYDSTIKRGAISNNKPIIIDDKNGSFGCASIKTYGDNIHSFIDDSNYRGLWAPKFIKLNFSRRKSLFFKHVWKLCKRCALMH